MAAIFVDMGKRPLQPLSGEDVAIKEITVTMKKDGNFGVLAMNVVNSNVIIPIKEYNWAPNIDYC